MQRVAGSVEEQLIVKSIREECLWDNLPKRLQVTLATKEEWHRRIVDYCIKKRLQWNSCFARKVSKEAEYYEEMMRYLKKNLALFPYHLAEYVCRVMRVSPFRYYCDMIFEVMKNEQPYDSIPNFSAADALRLTGIGRNEFIDIMNKCRSKKIMWKLNKSIAKEMLPTQPVDFTIEPWWGVCLVNFTIEEFKKLTEEEMATIDKICKEEANSYVLFEPDIIKALFKRGLVYFDVPVYPDDRFKVSRLEGFVSNREQLYEDPIEELLYAVFVVLSENATVAELAATLQADLAQLQAAASFACRLGWAEKLIDADSILRESGTGPGLVSSILSDEEDGSNASVSSDKSGQQLIVSEEPRQISGTAHVAFVVDANVTSYLMMGSLSPGLKSHAVTLYEAGKLADSCIADLCKDLATLEGKKFEGELQEFANHAFSLRCILECIQSGGIPTIAPCLTSDDPESTNELDETANSESDTYKKIRKYRVDILRCESLASLAPVTLERMFMRDYDIIVSMVPLPAMSVLPGATSGPLHFGPPSYSSMTPWMKLVLYTTGACGPLSVVLMRGQRLRILPAPLAGCEKALVWSWDLSTVVGGLGGKFEGNLVKGNILLHCLNSMLKVSAVLVQPLSKEDLDASGRVVTMDVALPLPNSDENSLPENLRNLTSFFSSISGLCTLGYIRLLRLCKIRESGDTSETSEKDNYEWVPLGLELGVPLFNPKLCEQIRDRINETRILQNDEFTQHFEGMQNLRRKLREMCNEYQATGPVAKMLYQRGDKEKEKEKEKGGKEGGGGPVRQMVSYASGRWSLAQEPSTPEKGGGANEHERLRMARRQRGRTEVVSYDGCVLRSYAIAAPVYEAMTRNVVEESNNQVKPESEDTESRDVVLPGVNLIFDGAELRPFDIVACLQARQPVLLVAEASAASASMHSTTKVS
ncbi:FAM91 carboxy-terminus protein [Rhynchospora pubera]|uniref:FAM91 carboxy-terminus protein n=1 Tax=Rhynchospora pubera TaxID=906938 RepID=A0AAV8D4U2_9POAL|nr:FAM91 carboxy-terminus protein [Rhynchospora pubera]